MKKRNLLKLLMLLVVFVGGAVNASAETVTDVITVDKLFKELPKTTYTDFSGIKISSDAVYAGQCGAGEENDVIQLRTKNSNSGIVSTFSGGTLKSVTIEWDSNQTADERVVDIYGANNAYTSASELYATTGNNNQGTKIGSAKCEDGDKTIEVDGDYTFVGIRSNNGAMYIKQITIVWETSSTSKADPELAYSAESFTYDFDNAAGAVFPSLTYNPKYEGTITYKSSKEDVATVDANGNVTPVGNGTTTITAVAESTDAFKSGSASYVLTVENKKFEIEDGVFDFTKTEDYGSEADLISDGSIYAEASTTWTAINVTMEAGGKYRWWYNAKGNSMRLYSGGDDAAPGSLTFSVPAGKVIKKIEITATTDSKDPGILASSEEGLDGFNWEGSAESVTLTHDGGKSINISKIVVIYENAVEDNITVSVGAEGFATFAAPYVLNVPEDSPIKAYVATVSGDEITLTKVNVVTRGQGVLLYGEPNATAEWSPSAEDVIFPGENHLIGTLTGIEKLETQEPTSANKNYILNVGSKGIGFYAANGMEVPAGKAYLSVPASTGAKQFYSIKMATGISELNAEKADNAIYNLNGVRVKEMNQKGVYIVNGKKVVKK